MGIEEDLDEVIAALPDDLREEYLSWYEPPRFTSDGTTVQCDRCGSLVGSVDIHSTWHEAVSLRLFILTGWSRDHMLVHESLLSLMPELAQQLERLAKEMDDGA